MSFFSKPSSCFQGLQPNILWSFLYFLIMSTPVQFELFVISTGGGGVRMGQRGGGDGITSSFPASLFKQLRQTHILFSSSPFYVFNKDFTIS